MDNSVSAVVGQQQQQHEAAQQKSKKKSKNKRYSGKTAQTTTANGQKDDEVVHTHPTECQVAEAVTNGLIKEANEKLHIDSTKKACKENGVAEAEVLIDQESHHPHHTSQNGHHTDILQPDSDDNDQQNHIHDHENFYEQTNGACALPSIANHIKKSKSSKSNKSKNKLNKEEEQQQQRTPQPAPAHTDASNSTGIRTEHLSDKLENRFSNKSNITNQSNTVDEQNTQKTAEVADIEHASTNQLNSHPTVANSVSTVNAVNSTSTASQDGATLAITATVVASNPAQTREKQIDAVSDVEEIKPALDLSSVHIEYKEYESELQMHDIMRLIQAELSEPYSIYTYRYFIYNWPKLCFLAAHGNEYVGAIVCKLDMHMNVRRGYIAMLAVRKEYRKLKIGTTLVQKAIEAMLADNADEVVLETEMRNVPALRLYENLGFVRDKRLFRYYLNGVDALRLKLWFR